MRYRDAVTMLDWLCDAFGFERRMVIEDENGAVSHAELTLGNGMIMIGSAREDAFGRLQKTPVALGGTTQSPYIVVGDVDKVYVRARAAGADIVIDIKDESYGRTFSCRDPEGHLWNFGNYDPWAGTG
jgi:uncharacterized glyoxalase superfamily protein PhnB